MNQIRIVHSFRGKKSNNFEDKNWLAVNACLYGLSALLCKKHGYYIKLYCDDMFYKYLKDTGIEDLYDEIDLSVNNYPLPPKGIYADTKFRAMQNEPIGTVHLDGDVLLFNKNILNNIIHTPFDVLIQHKETKKNCSGTFWYESTQSLKNCDKPNWVNPVCNEMYNCGVVCIKNEKLKQEYFDTYWKMYNEYSKKGAIDSNMPSVPDIIIEQQYLVDLCKYREYKVRTILPELYVHETAKNLGYSHLIGSGKFHHFTKVLKVIYKYNKEIYFKLKSKFYDNKIYKWKWPF